MGLSSSSMKELIELGANVEITDEAGYNSAALMALIRAAVVTGTHVTIHAGNFSIASLKDMVHAGNGNVTIVL